MTTGCALSAVTEPGLLERAPSRYQRIRRRGGFFDCLLGLFVGFGLFSSAGFAEVRNDEEDERHESREENWLEKVVLNGVGEGGMCEDEAGEEIEQWPEDEAED